MSYRVNYLKSLITKKFTKKLVISRIIH